MELLLTRRTAEEATAGKAALSSAHIKLLGGKHPGEPGLSLHFLNTHENPAPCSGYAATTRPMSTRDASQYLTSHHSPTRNTTAKLTVPANRNSGDTNQTQEAQTNGRGSAERIVFPPFPKSKRKMSRSVLIALVQRVPPTASGTVPFRAALHSFSHQVQETTFHLSFQPAECERVLRKCPCPQI